MASKNDLSAVISSVLQMDGDGVGDVKRAFAVSQGPCGVDKEIEATIHKVSSSSQKSYGCQADASAVDEFVSVGMHERASATEFSSPLI